MNETEQKAVISICILAAYADGSQSDSERQEVQQIAERFQQQQALLAASYQELLSQKPPLASVAQTLQSLETRNLAYEMAVCVCHADGALTDDEQRFLSELRTELRLAPEGTAAVDRHVGELVAAQPPLLAPAALPRSADKEADDLILNSAIFAGALELLPQSLATMAIIPVQMRMVYRIGQQHGFQLDRGHIKDFLATVGVGITSQVVEGFARRLVGNLTRKIGGRLIGGLATTATGSAVAFGTTYALGQLAKRYYASGRTLTSAQLQEVFSSLLNEGNALQNRYTAQIGDKSRQIHMGDLLPLVTQQ
jgi:uncharacterized protein (DUF697 family)/tellurite resistance protein